MTYFYTQCPLHYSIRLSANQLAKQLFRSRPGKRTCLGSRRRRPFEKGLAEAEEGLGEGARHYCRSYC